MARGRGCYPAQAGFVDHGALIDGVARPVCLSYAVAARGMLLDQNLLHPNGNLHLIGLPSDCRSRFPLDRVGGLRLAKGSEIDPCALQDELMALCGPSGSRVRPPQAGAEPPPRPGRLTRWFAEAWPRTVDAQVGRIAPARGRAALPAFFPAGAPLQASHAAHALRYHDLPHGNHIHGAG
ncbi:hypothetical protein [Paracoccus contaminans]|uniref:Uncharacterized protein n=1 Tax=Paracoccus contaminans TaxID=1945662 RepID=A0A1W6D1L7_9RHOB|nr:hypothetical protein [Paracoccus contaminans]ARJ70986.1 hypothetical protein B0A89_14240 [Paracoccus contaminans]